MTKDFKDEMTHLRADRSRAGNSTLPKGGFRVPNTVLWLMKHSFSKILVGNFGVTSH